MSSSRDAWEQIDDGIGVYRSSVNVGVLQRDGAALLIDCDDPTVVEGLQEEAGLDTEAVLLTHYHRDSAGGARGLSDGIDVVVPAAERQYFESVGEIWSDPEFRWHLADFRPHSLLPTRPIDIDDAVDEGERFDWQDFGIRVVATPGHTEHGVSYVVGVDDTEYAFCGDLLCGDGQLWDAYSLQRENGEHHDYHAYLGDRDRYARGVENLADVDMIVPGRGGVIEDPETAVANVTRRLDACYRNYTSIAALRYYRPETFDRENAMPVSDQLECPQWARHIEPTTWVLLSDDGHALVMDSTAPEIVERLRTWEVADEIRTVDFLWITHYHHDHVGAVEELRSEYSCPVVAERSVASVLENPDGYRLPCMVPDPIDVDRMVQDGQQWDWREWTLTAYWYPGQTQYHSALLAEGHGVRLLFAGDSFTVTGIDDYCMPNRNPLRHDRGYRYCIELLKELDPTHVFNCHLTKPFDFTDDQVEFIQEQLKERESLFEELLPWENPNFGLDPHWVRCRPYDRTLDPGDLTEITVEVTNYAADERTLSVRPELPPEWQGEIPRGEDQWTRTSVRGGATGEVKTAIQAPSTLQQGVYVIPVTVGWGDRLLRRFRETRILV